jgi:N-acetylmuramoyl-L-alanine amidase
MLTLAASGAASVRPLIIFEPQDGLIITYPREVDRVTASSRMSFLGAADPASPLYINGGETAMTAKGFFTAFVELEIGENIFIVQNGENEEEIIITREPPGEWTPPETEWFDFEVYGVALNDLTSRFANLNDDLYARTPLAAGTTFRILAEHGDFYIIEDDTAVFKSAVSQLDYSLPPKILSGGELSVSSDGVSVSFGANENPLYEVELDGDRAILTVYADNYEGAEKPVPSLQPDGKHVTGIALNTDEKPLVFEFTFAVNPVGFTVEFVNNTMLVNFRFGAASLSRAAVLLDAGHGGGDPGALGPPGEFGAMEKDFNLYVAGAARDYLEALGMNVIFIRDVDERIEIMDRMAHFALLPDISVSIHANSAGLSTDFSTVAGPLMYYTLDLSERVADDMIRIIAEETGNEYAPPKRQNFAMARYTGAPSMLFEMGFLCNPEEYEILLDTRYLERMGIAVGMAVEQYLTGFVTEITDEPPLVGDAHPGVPESDAPEPTPEAVITMTFPDYAFTYALIRYALFLGAAILLGAGLMLYGLIKQKNKT